MRYFSTVILILLIQLESPAQQVDHYFDSLKSVYHGKALFNKFQKYKKKTGLINGLKKELDSIQNDIIRQVAVIAIFHNLYGYKWVEDKKLIRWVDSVSENTLNPAVKNLALKTKTYFVEGIIGQQLVSISLLNHQGDTINTETLKGKYLIIDLWATWCGPCIQEMKKIPKLRKEYENLEFYSISFDDEYWRMQKFVRKKGYDWPIVFAGKDHPLWKYFRVSALPNYFIVDPQGKILVNTINGIESMIAKYVDK